MNIKLRNKPDARLSGKYQVLHNRGLEISEIEHYLETTDDDINDYKLLGEDKLKAAMQKIVRAAANGEKVLTIVDSDADGFTSAALFINYLYDHFPAWVQNNLDYFIHSGKQHGLEDLDVRETAEKYTVVVTPDASSNDYGYHLALLAAGVDVVVLDHHEAEIVSPNAIVINNQLCAYPNKHLSGVGIVWQFCRYFDSMAGTDYAQNYLDLVALGCVSDMMSLLSFETRHLVAKGFLPENIRNPFIATIARKNSFKLGDHINPHGAGWYIAPFINAMVRSGEAEEKEMLFKSMLKFEAHKEILSTKRGHKAGETESLIVQALRLADRVKERQDKTVAEAMAKFENMIQDRNLLDHKVLLFLLEPGQVEKNVAGLAANKFMAKYQRPCCILTRREIEETTANGTQIKIIYEGSARGCDATGVDNFKDICEETGVTEYTAGHQGAFGLGLIPDNIQSFVEKTDAALKDISDEHIYWVDYIFHNKEVPADIILSISELEDYYGKDIDESYIAITNLQVTSDMVNVYVKRNNTLKISISSDISAVMFDAPQDLCDRLRETQGYIQLNIIGESKRNEYMGYISAQIIIKELEIVGESKYIF